LHHFYLDLLAEQTRKAGVEVWAYDPENRFRRNQNIRP